MSTPCPPCGKVILLTGPPPASALDDMSSCTVTRFDDSFHAILSLPPPDCPCSAADDVDTASQLSHVAWRSLPLDRLLRPHLAGGPWMLSQCHHVSLHGSIVAPHVADETTAEEAWTQFCEQSLAQHHGATLPSQLEDSLADDDTTSFMTTLSPDLTSVFPAASVRLHLSDLGDVPPAKRILALEPQTVTLNLVVAVISLAQPRAVTTRWGQTLSLVEVLVGDITATGFPVTFWLDATQAEEGSVVRLRRQDVVLMENVALHVFRGKVYGQSLRKGLTKVTLMWRADGTGHYSSRQLDRRDAAKHPQQERTRLVKGWVLHFVGRDAASATTRPRKSWDNPPDDTQ